MSAKISTTLLPSSSRSPVPSAATLRALLSQWHPNNPSRPLLPFLLPRFQAQTSTSRPFATHPLRAANNRKQGGGKQNNKRPPSNIPDSKDDVDAHDLSTYKEAIAKAHETLKSELARVKAGGAGRDPEAIEGIRVKLGNEKMGKGVGGVKLGEMASVVPRGKNVLVIVGEKDHLKPILSSLAQPPHNLNAQSSTTDPLTLTIPLPPITHESRTAAAQVASQKGEQALFALREARGAHRKKLRALELGRLVGPDELRKAEKELDKANEGAIADAKKLVEEAKRKAMGQ